MLLALLGLGPFLGLCPHAAAAATDPRLASLPGSLRAVFENAKPLETPRGTRLPLFVLPISHALAGIPDDLTEAALRELNARGIGYSVHWNPDPATPSVQEALRIARLQQRLGMEVAADATSCLTSFFDGSDASLHEDDHGRPFAETSFGGKLGCPFSLEPRIPFIRDRIERFAAAYHHAGMELKFVFADWEIDGPIEWNDAWANAKRCRKCRAQLPGLEDFRTFQHRLRTIRSELQRAAFAEPILRRFPNAWVGNYAVNPHDGYRYWYDYFEKEAVDGMPFRRDQRARYREWAHEFAGTDYTCAIPVIYTWYPMFGWYDFEDSDFRWFRPMLLEASSTGRHTPDRVPLIPFVHWHTTAPPDSPDPRTRQFTASKYQDLLGHLLLRGHDTFFLWCMPNELGDEIRLLHEVYARSLRHADDLTRGQPLFHNVPESPGPVISAVRSGDRVLALRTDFGTPTGDLDLRLPHGGWVKVPARTGWQELEIQPPKRQAGLLRASGRVRFPIGFYEFPTTDADLAGLARAGVNVVRCNDRRDLDRAQAAGLLGWVSLPLDAGPTDALKTRIESLRDHPALALWEGPDELVWNFTAYSGLERSAGFKRADWERQAPLAVTHAAREGARVLGQVREASALLHRLDTRHRPLWINEAADSDVAYVRQYLEHVDITGCDYYPVRSTGTDLPTVGRLVDRWAMAGEGRPVWMVLQAFSWHTARPDRARLYPTYEQSRFMAFDAIVHGARGLFYWGSSTIDDVGFRTSLYRVIREVADLEPFLVEPSNTAIAVRVIPDVKDTHPPQVRADLRRAGNEFVLIVVNEDSAAHLALELRGLDALEGRSLIASEPSESLRVDHGRAITRLQGLQVKVFRCGAR